MLPLSGVRLRKVNKRSQLALSASITFWEILPRTITILLIVIVIVLLKEMPHLDNKQKAQVDQMWALGEIFLLFFLRLSKDQTSLCPVL